MQEADLCAPFCFLDQYQFCDGAVRELAITVKTEAMRTHNAVWGRFRELDPTQGAMIDRRLEPPMKDRVGLGASINFSALLLPLPPPPSPDPTRHPLEASTASAGRPGGRLRPLTDEGRRAGGC